MEYKIKSILVNKSVKMNVGNYESIGLEFGIEAEPMVDFKTDEEREIFIMGLSKDVDDILNPQMLKIREWAKNRHSGEVKWVYSQL